MPLVSSSSARYFSRYRCRKFTLSNDGNDYLSRQSKQIDPKVAWRWPSTPADYGKQSTICWITLYFGSWGTRLCKFHCRSGSTRGAMDVQSFACQRYMTNQTDGTAKPRITTNQTDGTVYAWAGTFSTLRGVKKVKNELHYCASKVYKTVWWKKLQVICKP